MARQESDREDLFAEAISLTRRVETRPLAIAELPPTPWIAGWRATGALSLYLGPDIAYHWDDTARLKRAFCDGFLYRTQGSTLARLQRQRTPTESHLLRYDLEPEALDAFRHTLKQRVRACRETLSATPDAVARQWPDADENLVADLLDALQRTLIADPWLAPPFAGKRR